MKRVTEFLEFAIEGREVLTAARAQKVLREWESVVGATLAARTRVDRFDHGTVWVEADGSAWAQEIRLNAETVLGRLNELAEEDGLFQRIKVGTRRPE